jgi:hypothetical protein
VKDISQVLNQSATCFYSDSGLLHLGVELMADLVDTTVAIIDGFFSLNFNFFGIFRLFFNFIGLIFRKFLCRGLRLDNHIFRNRLWLC